MQLFTSNSYSQWAQKGNDIDGPVAGDRAGSSVSMPDVNTIAIGARLNGDVATSSGEVRVFRWSGSLWVQKGADINGESAGDQSGSYVCMPDSNTVAIGAKFNDGNGTSAGHVRVFSWNGSAWNQKGIDIDGEAANDQAGASIDMPDANTVAVGAPYNDGSGINAGHVRVFTWSGSAWIQKGADIDGEFAADNFGFSVSMPHPDTIAIGAPFNNGLGTNVGHVRVMVWNGSSWVQRGSDIDGEAPGDQSGTSVSMVSGNVLAIGAPGNNGSSGLNSGHVRVYKWSATSWIQLGTDIDGGYSGRNLGRSVSMASKTKVAIGATGSLRGVVAPGRVRVYEYILTPLLDWVQKGGDIMGEGAGDFSGASISMVDTGTVAIGAERNDGGGNLSGHARIYQFGVSTDLTEKEPKGSFLIYPNPADESLYIESSTIRDERVQIISLSGQIIREEQMKSNVHLMKLEDFNDGLYFIKLGGLTKKLIIQH